MSAIKRILADLKELNANPLPNISAAPLESSLFTWHVSIVAQKNSPYYGGIFHGALFLPQEYPNKGPDFVMLSDIAHPHVYGGKVCLSMLNNTFTGHFQNEYEKWNPAYTILSILVQLENFLMNPDDVDESSRLFLIRDKIASCVKQSTHFKCNACGHKFSKPFPPLPSVEELRKAKKANAQFESELELYKAELVCFHSRASFEETVLGMGINVERRGKQRTISSPMYLLSRDAFNSGIRSTPFGDKFEYFLPLWINEEHGKRAKPFIEKDIALICGEVEFKPEMAVEVLSALMNTIVVNMMSYNQHYSMKTIEGYNAFHRLLIMFVLEYPELRQKVNDMVDTFVENEKNRRKDKITALGEWITLLSVSDKTWRDRSVVRGYLSEMFDRNAFWIAKAHPDLANEHPDPKTDATRLSRTFTTTAVSNRLLMFHVYFLNHVARFPGLSLEDMAATMDSLYGRPTLLARESLQKACVRILQAQNFDDFFDGIEFPNPSAELLLETLRLAMSHSRKKGYHKSPKKYHLIRLKNADSNNNNNNNNKNTTGTKSGKQEEEPVVVLTKDQQIASLRAQLETKRKEMEFLQKELNKLLNEEQIISDAEPEEVDVLDDLKAEADDQEFDGY